MDLDVRRLLTLRAVRDAGGVLAAAAALHVSASAVSQQLAKLERETGLALVDRTSATRVRLTPAGIRLSRRADAIADELGSTRSEILDLRGQRAQTVTVAGFPSVLESLVALVARDLRDAEPAITVRIRESRDDPNAVRAALLDGSLDIALVKHGDETPPPAGIVETIVRDDPFHIVVPADWPVPTSLTDLFDAPWIGHAAGSPQREPFDRIESRERIRLDYAHECTEYPVALSLVGAGLAAAIVPSLALGRHDATRVRILPFGDLGQRRIAAHHAVDRTTAGVLATLDAIRSFDPTAN